MAGKFQNMKKETNLDVQIEKKQRVPRRMNTDPNQDTSKLNGKLKIKKNEQEKRIEHDSMT